MKRRGRDPTRASGEPFDAETIEHLHALMDRAVTFHRIKNVDKSRFRKKTTQTPADQTDRR